MSETIKTYTPVEKAEALELAKDGGLFAFSNNGWAYTEPQGLAYVRPSGNSPYESIYQGSFITCYTITELDPCQAPDGCPELEPWMAYVGTDIFPMTKRVAEYEDSYYICADDQHRMGPPMWVGGYGCATEAHKAIDVRTAWAQEHFPEHCRIRNYQEPAKYGYFEGDLITAPEGWELLPEGEEFTGELWYVTDYEGAKFRPINYRAEDTCIARIRGSVIGYFRKIQEPDPLHELFYLLSESCTPRTCGNLYTAEEMKMSYELGQQNPKTK